MLFRIVAENIFFSEYFAAKIRLDMKCKANFLRKKIRMSSATEECRIIMLGMRVSRIN